MSGYFSSQLLNPLIFATHNPVVAGQMGMSLQICSAINGVAAVWITTKMPLFEKLIARGERTNLDSIFRKSLIKSMIFLRIGIVSVFVGVIFINKYYFTYFIRIVSPSIFLILLFVSLVSHVVFAEACYLRSHKEE
jgi:hypothetical protein